MEFRDYIMLAEARDWPGRHLWIAAAKEEAQRLIAVGPEPDDEFAERPDAFDKVAGGEEQDMRKSPSDFAEPVVLEFKVLPKAERAGLAGIRRAHERVTVHSPKLVRFLRVWSGVLDDAFAEAARQRADGLDEIAIGGLKRCTAVTVTALCKHFHKPGVTLAEVPETDVGVLALLSKHGLGYKPVPTAAGRTVQQFANLNGRGAFYLVTQGHAMALVQGELFDAENRGPDGRKIIEAFAVSLARR